MFRLFVGIAFPEDVRTALAGLCAGLPGAKWVAAENLHLSLRFIGEVGAADADDIHHALARLAAQPFALTIAGVGCFETGRRVHTLWAGIDKEPRLLHLQEKVESAVVRTGFEPERRKFKPHVTLARFRNGTQGRLGVYVETHNRFKTGPFAVDHFTLFRSHLGGAGPHYETLAEYPLTE
ncbi:MAG: RNA 2',3'-cyclic phosphodiesterase [Rhodospirillales bacterium]